MLKKILIVAIIVAFLGGWFFYASKNKNKKTGGYTEGGMIEENNQSLNPLSIEYLRDIPLDASITIEEEIDPGVNYKRYIASYLSDGYKIYGLLTVPNTQAAEKFPAIVFNHGYIPPKEYRTTERYVAYVDSLARNGFVVFKIDYRGHGQSEGPAEGGYGSNGYTIDALNAAVGLAKLSYVDANRIGLWGHSMGGWISTRAAVARPELFSAVVVWAGVVGSYQDLIDIWWSRRPTPDQQWRNRSRWRQQLAQSYGPIADTNPFWQSVSTVYYLKDLKPPVQLHHARGDATVPFELSVRFSENLKKLKKTEELYLYPEDDHNITANFSLAMERTVEFFNRYLKNR
jgi:dipeptidyl aminopeptidase/acylaminoacyl peptidase